MQTTHQSHDRVIWQLSPESHLIEECCALSCTTLEQAGHEGTAPQTRQQAGLC